MKLIETLTPKQIIDMLNGTPVGIFPSMIYRNDVFYKYISSLCTEYYISHSGEKTISPAYDKIINYITETKSVKDSAADIIGKLVRNKFIDKWNKIYTVLIEDAYNPLDDRTFQSKINTIVKEQSSSDESNVYTANNKDTTSYNNTLQRDGKFGSEEVRTRDGKNANDYYGFNSSSPVNDTESSYDDKETVTGNADKNTSKTLETKGGTDTLNSVKNETDKKNTKDITDTTNDRLISENGRTTSGAILVDAEIDMRKRQIFADIIYSDIDSITTLSIYI